MDEQSNIAPEEESKDTSTSSDASEETIGDVLGDEKSKKEDTVPLSALLEFKSENKTLKKELADLKRLVEDGGSKREVSQSLKEIGEKHSVDGDFLQDLVATIRAEVNQEVRNEVSSTLKPIQDKERQEKIDKVFAEHFDKTVAAMPQFKDVVNKDVIKALSLDPKNANKTFAQLFEESYGHVVQGRRTLDSGTPGISKGDDAEIDYGKAQSDPEYFKEVMGNPSLKKKYNEGIDSRLKTYL